MANKTKLELVQTPFSNDQELIPVLLVDINGDGSAYAAAAYETNPSAGSGGSLGTSQLSTVAMNDTAQAIIAVNATRLSLMIVNDSTTDTVYIHPTTPTIGPGSLKLQPNGGYYSSDKTRSGWYGICETGKTANLTIEEVVPV